jgi:excinuclease ABC subunit B
MGTIDVLVGVNLLREGLDLPEVSMVAILDADKEGFLRSERSLTQTIGRAARNERGKVIMYADKITESMRRTISETERRRTRQILYNTQHGITPKTIIKSIEDQIDRKENNDFRVPEQTKAYVEREGINLAADPVISMLGRDELKKLVDTTKSKMMKAAKELDFIEAARLRDEMQELEKLLSKKIRN